MQTNDAKDQNTLTIQYLFTRWYFHRSDNEVINIREVKIPTLTQVLDAWHHQFLCNMTSCVQPEVQTFKTNLKTEILRLAMTSHSDIHIQVNVYLILPIRHYILYIQSAFTYYFLTPGLFSSFSKASAWVLTFYTCFGDKLGAPCGSGGQLRYFIVEAQFLYVYLLVFCSRSVAIIVYCAVFWSSLHKAYSDPHHDLQKRQAYEVDVKLQRPPQVYLQREEQCWSDLTVQLNGDLYVMMDGTLMRTCSL